MKECFLELYKNLLDKDGKLTAKETAAVGKFYDAVQNNLHYFTMEQWAYVYATVFHETAHTFEPVKEAFWLSENWRKNNLRYYPYYGRGFVQITWLENYKKFGKLLGYDLVNNPDKIMEFDISFQILILGMKKGLFTGKKISDYADYKNARRVINGTDKADLIASYANTFLKILKQCKK